MSFLGREKASFGWFVWLARNLVIQAQPYNSPLSAIASFLHVYGSRCKCMCVSVLSFWKWDYLISTPSICVLQSMYLSKIYGEGVLCADLHNFSKGYKWTSALRLSLCLSVTLKCVVHGLRSCHITTLVAVVLITSNAKTNTQGVIIRMSFAYYLGVETG